MSKTAKPTLATSTLAPPKTAVLAWHFLGEKRTTIYLPDAIEAGQTHTVTGPLVMCEWGLHACQRAYDCLEYERGPIVCRVACWGDVLAEGEPKLVARNRHVLWMADATDVLRAWARRCASDVLPLWSPPAPQAVTDYLASGDPALRSAAESAAESAAWSAAETAAESAAESAAWSAAETAARSAAESAARSAAWNAAWSAARSAARSAAWNAARSAAWNAAWNAARSAAWNAAWSAAWSDKITRYAGWLEADLLALDPARLPGSAQRREA